MHGRLSYFSFVFIDSCTLSAYRLSFFVVVSRLSPLSTDVAASQVSSFLSSLARLFVFEVLRLCGCAGLLVFWHCCCPCLCLRCRTRVLVRHPSVSAPFFIHPSPSSFSPFLLLFSRRPRSVLCSMVSRLWLIRVLLSLFCGSSVFFFSVHLLLWCRWWMWWNAFVYGV